MGGARVFAADINQSGGILGRKVEIVERDDQANPDIGDRKSTRLNSSHTEIYTLSLHDALPIYGRRESVRGRYQPEWGNTRSQGGNCRTRRSSQPRHRRSEEHTSELQSHRDLHSFPTRRSSDLWAARECSRPISTRVGEYSVARWKLSNATIKPTPTS